MFTRIKEHKKDQLTKANGALVFKAHGQGQPLAADDVPKMVTLEDVEKVAGENLQLYAQSITRSTTKVVVAPGGVVVVWVPAINPNKHASAFDPNALGQWIKSQEKHDGAKLETFGLIRAALGVLMKGQTLQPHQNRTPTHCVRS